MDAMLDIQGAQGETQVSLSSVAALPVLTTLPFRPDFVADLFRALAPDLPNELTDRRELTFGHILALKLGTLENRLTDRQLSQLSWLMDKMGLQYKDGDQACNPNDCITDSTTWQRGKWDKEWLAHLNGWLPALAVPSAPNDAPKIPAKAAAADKAAPTKNPPAQRPPYWHALPLTQCFVATNDAKYLQLLQAAGITTMGQINGRSEEELLRVVKNSSFADRIRYILGQQGGKLRGDDEDADAPIETAAPARENKPAAGKAAAPVTPPRLDEPPPNPPDPALKKSERKDSRTMRDNTKRKVSALNLTPNNLKRIRDQGLETLSQVVELTANQFWHKTGVSEQVCATIANRLKSFGLAFKPETAEKPAGTLDRKLGRKPGPKLGRKPTTPASTDLVPHVDAGMQLPAAGNNGHGQLTIPDVFAGMGDFVERMLGHQMNELTIVGKGPGGQFKLELTPPQAETATPNP